MQPNTDKTLNDGFQKNMNLALRLLARRAHSVMELKRKLLSRGVSHESCGHVIDECRRLRLVDDALLADDYRAELAARNFGTLKIKAAMRKKGIEESIIETALRQDTASELERGRAALKLKLRLLSRETDGRKKREKAYRFLASRGFSGEIIRAVMEDLGAVN